MENRYSTINIRDSGQKKTIKIGSKFKPEIVSSVIQKWQSLIDVATKIINVPSGLIMKLNEDNIEVFVKSQTVGNPYEAGKEKKLIYGLYCETVIGTQKQLLIPDATKNEVWKENNPDVDIHMISYLGLPVNWPDGEVFGAVCLLDNKENNYNQNYSDLLNLVKIQIETDLQLLVAKSELAEQNKELKQTIKSIETLENSDKRFRIIFENSQAVMLLIDPKTHRIVAANKAAEKFYGWKRSEIEKMRVDDINTLSPEALNSEMEKARKSERIYFRFKHRLASGELRDVEIYSGKVEIDGKDYLHSIIHDITEQVKTETALQQSQAYNRMLFEQSQMGLALSDMDGKLMDINSAYAAIIGRTIEETKQLTYWDITPEKYAIQEQEVLESLKKTGHYGPYEKEYIHKNGHLMPVRLQGLIIEKDGKKYIWSSVENILERKQAEEKLLLNDTKYQYLFEINPLPMWIYDLNTLSFLEVNEAAIRHYGFSKNEFGYMTIKDIRPEEDVNMLLADVADTHNSYNKAGVWRHRKKNGELIFVEIISHLINYDNKSARLVLVNDVTDKKKAEAALRESEEQYRTLFENMNAGFVLFEVVQNEQDISVDLIILAANEGFEKTIGMNLKDAIGRHLTKVLPGIEKDEADWIGTYSKVALTGKAIQFEQGSELLGYYYSVSAFKAGSKQCAVTFVDITARKQAELKLAESEERLRLATEQANVAVWEIDSKSNSMFRSSNHDKLFGLEWQDKWDMNTFFTATHPDDHEYSNNYIRNTVAPGGTDDYRFDIRVVFPDNSIHWLLVYGRVVERNENGQGVRVRGTNIDITDQKQAELALRESEARYRNIIEAAPVGIGIHQQGKLVFINPAGMQILGAQFTEQLIGKNISSFIFPDNLKNSAKRIQRLLNGEEGLYPFEDKYVRLDGIVIDVEVMATLILYKNKPAVQVIISDITEKKRLREELKKLNTELELKVEHRTTQLMAVNKELETFTYSVSHDLKAPLRGIDGYSKLLLDEYGSSLNEEAAHFIHTIRDSTLQMNRLIEDLLSYSRLERSHFKQEKIALRSFTETLVLNFREEIKKDRFEVEINIPEVEIAADSTGLSIALRNYIENAIKFTREKPNPKLEINFNEKPETWIIAVKDNGEGFDMKYHDRIFEIFQRLHRAEDFPGTGIGLAMVAKAAQRMNGKIRAESIPGVGSTFFIEIPKNKSL